MTINAGVWIDHDKAVVVLLTSDGSEVLHIPSHDDRERLRGGRQMRTQVIIRLNAYYDDVINCVREAQAIVILGPGETKSEFRRRISSLKLRGHIAEMTTVAKLTDQQIVDYVRQHFQ